jgi:hypothetical protein
VGLKWHNEKEEDLRLGRKGRNLKTWQHGIEGMVPKIHMILFLFEASLASHNLASP